MKGIAIQLLNTSSIKSGCLDCESNNAKKNHLELGTFSKMLEKQNTPNILKLSKTIESNFNLSFLKKQPSFDIMLEIDNGLMRE
jgi:hypothetical protein